MSDTKIDLDDIERKARAATQESWVTPATAGRMPDYFARYAIVTTESGEQVADAFDNTTWSDEQCAANAQHIAANSPPLTLALIKIAKALVAFEAVQAEIDAEHDGPGIEPMSPRAVELGGKSIAAWKRVAEALKAVMP